MYSLFKAIDKQAGIFLRWFANLLTGNTFIHLRKSLRGDIGRAERAAIEARDIARRLHDSHQDLLLRQYKKEASNQ